MADLKSRPLIVAKGVMLLITAAMCAYLILSELPSMRVAVLLLVLVWASCRFYYFLFYVLERYVDPSMRYAGIWALLQELFNRNTRL